MQLFGKSADPKEQMRKWKKEMRGEQRKVDRQINHIKREEMKVKTSIKQAAKRGDMSSAKTLASEIVRSRKAVNRLHTTKAQMNSVMMQMENQVGQKKLMGSLQKSSVIMGAMNKLVKVEGISQTMQSMQQEMCRAGLIEEMVDDAFDAMADEDDEAAADQEVEKVMTELNVETMGGAQAAPSGQVSQGAQGEEEDLETMRARLAQLSS